MNIQMQCVDSSYSLSGAIATLTFTFQLVDTDITDAEGNPKVLDTATITVRQNVMDENAKDKLKQKILNEVQKYLTNAKATIAKVYAMFGTIDPDEILNAIKNDIQQDVQNLVSSTFGGN